MLESQGSSHEIPVPMVHDPSEGSDGLAPGIDESPTEIRKVEPSPELSTPAEAIPDLLGRTLDHFELLDCIGAGGMGRVFRARDTRLDRLVALKVLSPEQGKDEEVYRRFQQEAKAAARLNDPHFARVYYIGKDQGLDYIAMEHVEGENLRRKIERAGRLEFPFVLHLGYQIAQGLTHAARCGVVHRDIKPSNIIVTPEGTSKLVDMGLARSFLQHSSPDGEITQAGATLGTFDYISPEQAKDPRLADVRSDIYSLGCTLYHALTGRPPFPEGTALQKLLQHQGDTAPDPRAFCPDLPSVVVDLLMKMMAKDPRARYQTAGELVASIRKVAAELDVPLSHEAGFDAGLGDYGDSFVRQQVAWLAPLVVFLVAVGVFAFLDRGQDPVIPAQWTSQLAGDPDPPRSLPVAPVDSVDPSAAPTVKAQAGRPERGPQVVRVPPSANLAQRIADARSGDTLLLEGARYEVMADGSGRPAIRIDKDLTLQSSTGNLVTIHFQPGSGSAPTAGFVMEVQAGRLSIERVRLRVPSNDGAPQSIAVLAGQVTLRQCVVDTAGPMMAGPVFVLGSERPESSVVLTAESCYLGPGRECVRIHGAGTVAVEMADCTLAHFDRMLELEDSARLTCRMRHVSAVVRDGPALALAHRSGVEFHVIQSVFCRSESDSSAAFLDVAEIEQGVVEETDLWWGRGNLYCGFEESLLAVEGNMVPGSFEQLADWGVHELGPIELASGALWDLGQPWEVTNAQVDANPVLAYRLAAGALGDGPGPAGVRTGPWGPIYGADAGVGMAANTSPRRARPTELTVDPEAAVGEPGVYRFLTSACEEADSGMTISLRTNQAIRETDIRLENKHLILQAASGFQPRLLAQLEPGAGAATQRIFSLGPRSKLRLVGIAVEIEGATEGPMPGLGVAFECAEDSEVEIESAWVHLGKVGQARGYALARVPAPTTPVSMPEMEDRRTPARVILRNCVVRSGGSLLQADPPAYWSLVLTECFLASNESLVNVAGASEMGVGRRSNQVEVSQSTAMLRDSFVSMDAYGTDPDPPRNIEVLADRSVFLGAGQASMTRSRGNHPADRQERAVRWQGAGNFMAGFPVLFAFEGRNIGLMPAARSLTPNDWLAYFGLAPLDYWFGALDLPHAQSASVWQWPIPAESDLSDFGLPVEPPQRLGVPRSRLPIEPL